MRKYLVFIIILISSEIFAQNNVSTLNLEVNDRKFLTLKFPAPIKYADMGSADLTAEKVLDKILILKSVIPYFQPTNLSVVTTDGKYYSFVVKYNPSPDILAINMEKVTNAITSDNIIPYTPINVSDVHTSHIILPHKIENIAVGFDNIISEQAQEIDNIVKLKSVIDENEEFFQTSITIITSDENIFPLLVDYEKNPKQLTISFKNDSNVALFSGVNVSDLQMKNMAEWIIKQGQKINDIGIDANKMTFYLNSVYTDQDILAFYLSAKNKSKIDYTIDFIKAYIKDKKTAKKTAVQEEEIYPIYTYHCADKIIKAKESYDIVLFYRKFTIPQKRILYFELFENNGGRQVKFSASNNVIISADIIDNNINNN